MPRSTAGLCGLLAICLGLFATPARAAFTAFESGHVRGLALSADGSRLYALNTPDNRLEIFEVSDAGLLHLSSVPVGLEPVAVAVRGPNEVWVVNQLSDDVSIVSTAGTPRVVRTLLVGDEPSDVVFAGPGRNRAFVTSARRGQNSPIPANNLTPGIGRALVFVFDANALGTPAGGVPIAVLTLFGDAPRGLAASPDGSRVYAGIFHSGNQTTAIPVGTVQAIAPAMLPSQSVAGQPAPPVSQIVRWNGSQWLDDRGRDWTAQVRFSLPDQDVFSIDANATPALMPGSIVPFARVGTILFNLAVNPANGRVWVTNGEARNERRFEGQGVALIGLPLPQRTVRGQLHEYRVTVLDPAASSVTPRHLNKHIDYTLSPAATEAAGTADHSLATPLDVAFDSAGTVAYVAAFGSSKVGVFAPSALENDSFVPSAASQIEISGGGPSSLALDEARQRLYVLARFEQTISIVDVSSAPGAEVAVVPLPHDPEPASLREGRRFLYDARFTSSNGEASCSSCHIFGNMDDLSWDLGDPDGVSIFNGNTQAIPLLNLDQLNTLDQILNGTLLPDGFFLEHHPLKGPMLTQSLRGLANHGPMHWRGDRSGAGAIRNDPNSLDENAAFNKFNVAFEGLLGRTAPLSTAEMQAFTDFMLQVRHPPNPNRNLDDSLTAGQANALNIYNNVLTDGMVAGGNPAFAFTCNQCHTLDVAAGFFGGDGDSSFDGETQIFKVPHLRNLYARVGMFGINGLSGNTGPQIRGFGVLHDGSVDTVLSFVSAGAFTFPGATAAERNQNRRDMAELMFAFDSDLAPILGQQVTVDAAGTAVPLLAAGGTVNDRINLLVARAAVTAPRDECDLVVKGEIDGEPRGWWLSGADAYTPDRDGAAAQTLTELLALAQVPGRSLTFSCVPGGSGARIGIDRDEDGIRDGSECGDVSLDGVVAENDAVLLRRALAQLPGGALAVPGKCDVGGAPACDIVDAVVIARAAQALGPGAAQACDAAF